MISITGPDWPSVRELRTALATAPETGIFHTGGPKILATEQLRRFAEAGLRVPEWTKDNQIARSWLNTGSTVLARRENHTQGRDIMIRNLMDTTTMKFRNRWNTQEWWCKFVPSTEEWRIHVFDGRVIARGKKVSYGIVSQDFIRSRRNGWLLRHDLAPTDALRDAGRGAIAAVGYLYGAVDILVTSSGPVVLEANRLPAMDSYTRDAYVRAIRRYVGGRKIPRSDRGIGEATPSPWYEGVEVA